jgi:hypothetical protein
MNDEHHMDAQRLIDRATLDFVGLSKGFDEFAPVVCDRSIISYLRAERKRQRLIPVLGAGVSSPVGIPGWDRVLETLCNQLVRGLGSGGAAFAALGSVSLISLARVLESESRFRTAFRVRLRQKLYENFCIDYKNSTLKSLVSLLCRKDGKPVRSIITYNFDNALELYVTKLAPSLKADSVYSHQTFMEASGDIEIYHPHGYLPFDESLEEPNSLLVFSERDYHNIYHDSSSWATLVQMSAFTKMTCVFIGLSMRDPNLRRLVDRANSVRRSVLKSEPHHVAIMRCGNLTEPEERWRCYFIDKDLHSLGIRTLWIEDFQTLYRVLSKI